MTDTKFYAHEPVLYERGYGLDAIGAQPDVDLPRDGLETDHDYRNRLIEKKRSVYRKKLLQSIDAGSVRVYTVADGVQSAPMTSAEYERYIAERDHEWHGPMGTETTAPDEPKPNHVRDAVRANS
jgi:hypothetical protein